MTKMEKLYNAASDAIQDEHKLLKNAKRGLFLLQEEALVYIIARRIIRDFEKIFGKVGYEIATEKKGIDGRKGPVDLVLEVENEGTIVFEFKTRSSASSCISDIEKLRKVPEKYRRIFCALIETSKKDLNRSETVRALDDMDDVSRVCDTEFYAFETENYATTRTGLNTGCLIGMWEIGQAANK